MRNLFFLSFSITFFICNSCYSQKDDSIIRSVLKKNQTNKVCLFDSSNKADGLYKIYVTYLGKINTNGKEYKIITVKTIWGPNKHTSGTIFIYNKKNYFFGKYSLGDGLDLPNRLQKNQLIFTNQNKPDCDSKLVTVLGFDKEIPQKIFLKCKGDKGDIYTFSTEK